MMVLLPEDEPVSLSENVQASGFPALPGMITPAEEMDQVTD